MPFLLEMYVTELSVFFASYSRLSRDFRGGGGLAKFSRLAVG